MSTGYARVNVADVKDVAPDYGMGEVGECRPLTKPVGGEGIGATYYTLRPNTRHGFGHSHDKAEEMYLVLAGSGRAKLDDEIVELSTHDLIRCAPPVMREFEGGPDGLTLLAFGHRIEGDGGMKKGFWPQDDTPAS
jgi:quercetin dioxygenase-like cupin family protein